MRNLNPQYVEAVSALVNRCPYFTLLSMSIRDIGIGYSLLDIDVQNKHLQPFEAVHGGVFASIIDAAAFWAVFPEVDENVGMTSVDLKVNYLAPAQSGKLIARGRRIKLGKTLSLGEAEVINQENTILAHGTSTLMVLRNLGGAFKHSLPPKFIEEE
ncbi:MAG: PaaI family thioesterase [Thermodesulfobacteriota bacterium]